MAQILYDPRCEELARVVLDEQEWLYDDEHVQALAGAIQTAIEERLTEMSICRKITELERPVS